MLLELRGSNERGLQGRQHATMRGARIRWHLLPGLRPVLPRPGAHAAHAAAAATHAAATNAAAANANAAAAAAHARPDAAI